MIGLAISPRPGLVVLQAFMLLHDRVVAPYNQQCCEVDQFTLTSPVYVRLDWNLS